MGSRGTASSSTTIPSDNLAPEVYDVIGQKVYPTEELQMYTEYFRNVVNKVNPKYWDNTEDYKKYHWNCQRCAPALELRMRGYDVEAMPYNGNALDSYQSVFNYDSFDFDNNVVQSSSLTYVGQSYTGTKKNPNKFGKGAKAATKTIIDAMNRWGPKSRAMMMVSWKNTSSSHIVNVARVNGNISIIDGQSGKVYEGAELIQKYMQRTVASRTALLRVDHLTIRDGADRKNILSKIVKKRESK